ncbi:hypothetical protein ABVT39_008983 [Epinephelus coioides]
MAQGQQESIKGREPGGCSPIKPVKRAHPYRLPCSGPGCDSNGHRGAGSSGKAGRACALTAIGKRKDLRRRCQSQSMRSRGRKGERARMAQMEPDKKGRVLQKRGRETGDNTVYRDSTSAWDSGNTTGRQSADVNSHPSSRHKLKKKSFSCEYAFIVSRWEYCGWSFLLTK